MIKVFEAFSGIGTQRMALRNLGIEHEVVAIAEIDKFAIKSYEAIHGEVNNLGDISKIDTKDIPDHDLFTYSFPCQDISVAGKGLGLDEGSDTRSGLLWECQKVIAVKKPKYLLLENVKNLVGKKHKHNFDKWLEWLSELGYTNYWQVLNAKDYGIPQNRERVFVVSILGNHEPYKFPEPVELELRLKDALEDEVDEKFYLSEEKTQQLVTTISEKHSEQTAVKMNRNEVKDEQDIASTLLARDYKGFGNQDMTGVVEPNVLTPKRTEYGKAIRKDYEKGLIKESRHNMTEMRPRTDGVSNTLTTVLKDNYVAEPKAKRIGGIFDSDGKTHQAGAIWDKEGLSPTLDTMQGGWRQPSVVVDNSDIKPIKNEVVPEVIGGIGEKNFGSQFRQGNRVYDVNKIATALTASPVGNAGGHTPLYADKEILTKNATDSKEVVIGASRGRNPENPSDRTVGSPTEQRLEINKQGTSNTITTVQKDNYVVEPLGTLAAHNSDKFGTGYMDDVSKTLKANKHDISVLYNNFRIRKLTPLECWRLMGCTDEDFHKAEQVNSNSQLYKQAGNAIVVDVLEGIFSKLFGGSK